MSNSNHQVFFNVRGTRWNARLDGFDRIFEVLRPVLYTIEDISENRCGPDNELGSGDWNQKSKDAQHFIKAIDHLLLLSS